MTSEQFDFRRRQGDGEDLMQEKSAVSIEKLMLLRMDVEHGNKLKEGARPLKMGPVA